MNYWIVSIDKMYDVDTDSSDISSQVGTGDPHNDPTHIYNYQFRLLDDDGNVYYEGFMDALTFEPLGWGKDFAGCTILQYRKAYNHSWETL